MKSQDCYIVLSSIHCVWLLKNSLFKLYFHSMFRLFCILLFIIHISENLICSLLTLGSCMGRISLLAPLQWNTWQVRSNSNLSSATPTTSCYQWPGLCITDFEIEDELCTCSFDFCHGLFCKTLLRNVLPFFSPTDSWVALNTTRKTCDEVLV